MSNIAIATTKGSRARNEDYELGLDNKKFSIVLILDGHSGEDLKSAFAEKMKEKLEIFIEVTDEIENMENIIDSLKKIYYDTLEYIDTLSLEGGTTMSLGVFQKHTRHFFTVQIGDSTVFLADSHKGEIIECLKIFASDDALPKKEFELGYQKCITNTQDFTVEDEINLYLGIFRERNLPILIQKRKDTTAFENRYLAKVSYHYLPEPSRTIEPKEYYNEYNIKFLMDVQRTPEISVFYVDPAFINLALCAVCDGFVSKKAIPNLDKVAQVLLNPGIYIKDTKILEGTLIGNWLETKNLWGQDYVKPCNQVWDLDPILYSNRLVHKVVRDKEWKNAVEESMAIIEEIRGRIPQDEVRACLNLQDCVNMAVQVPISIASDDNVSCCVILL